MFPDDDSSRGLPVNAVRRSPMSLTTPCSKRRNAPTGTMTMGPGIEAPFTWYWKRPHMLRVEFTLQGQTGIQAFDGTTGWMYMPFMGKTEPEKMPDDLLSNVEDQSDFERFKKL